MSLQVTENLIPIQKKLILTPKIKKPPKPVKKNRWVRVLIWVTILALIFFLLAGFLGPWLASRQIEKMTGKTFGFGFLSISPTGHVSTSFKGGEAVNNQIHLETGSVRFDWWMTFFKKIRIGHVKLHDAQFEIEKNLNGELIVNSVNLKSLEKEPNMTQPQEQSQGQPWGLGIGQIDFSNLSIKYKDADLSADLLIDHLTLGAVESWKPKQKTPFEANLTLNGGKIYLKGHVTPLSTLIEMDSKVTISDIPWDLILSVLKEPRLQDVGGDIMIDGNIVSQFLKHEGQAQAEWNGNVTFENTTALYETSSPKGSGQAQKLRVLANGPIQFEKVLLDINGLKPDSQSQSTMISFTTVKNSGPFLVEVQDESFRRAPKFKLDPLDFELHRLSAKEPNQPMTFDVKASLGKYDRVSLAGSLNPFAKIWNGQFTAKLSEINLTPFTAYSERHSGSRIQTGVFGLETKATIQNNQLVAENDVLLKKLKFQIINKEKEEEGTGKVGMPLNVFISLLKNKNGDINLKIPVKGPAQDPSVGTGPLLVKLTAKAAAIVAKKAVTNFFPPLKAAQITGKLVKFTTKWRFDPILFKPGTLEVMAESEDYLKEVGGKLKDRPKVHLSVCGFGTRQDLSQKVLEENLPPLSQEEKDKLLKFAEDRAAFIKDFLVNQHGIDSERLLICSPDSEEKAKALPRGTLSL